MTDAVRKPRPEYRNIGFADITMKYRMPLAAILSILHRVSGALLFLFLPFLPSDNPSVRIALGASLVLASLVVGPTAAEWGRLPWPSRPVAPIAR